MSDDRKRLRPSTSSAVVSIPILEGDGIPKVVPKVVRSRLPLPTRWPLHQTPETPTDELYTAVQAAELTWLIHRATEYRELMSPDGEDPYRVAYMAAESVVSIASMMVWYSKNWYPPKAEPGIRPLAPPIEFHNPLGWLIEDFAGRLAVRPGFGLRPADDPAEIAARRFPYQFADFVSSPSILATLKKILGLAPVDAVLEYPEADAKAPAKVDPSPRPAVQRLRVFDTDSPEFIDAVTASKSRKPLSNTADDGRLRPKRTPVVATPSHLPPVWDGEASPGFQDNLTFNRTALRAHLAHLIDRAKAYREAWGAVESPPDVAGETVRRHAFYVWHYFSGLRNEVDAALTWCDMVIPPHYFPSLKFVVDRVVAASFGMTAIQSANALSDPEMLRILEWGYGLLPCEQFDLDMLSEHADLFGTTAREGSDVAPEVPTARQSTSEADGIDFSDLARKLRLGKRSKPKQAALVEFFADKAEASLKEVAVGVHGDPRTTWNAVKTNVDATNKSLEEMPSRLRFEVRKPLVYRLISPE